jgi:mevalonate kinase
MIPSGFLKYFQIAQETSRFALKLCGSGGGGFLLGFTSDMEYVTKLFSNDDIKLLTVNFN